MEQAARYVAAQFQAIGLQPGGNNGSWFQRYPVLLDSATSPSLVTSVTVPNVIGMLEGKDPKLKREYVLVVAHMDGSGVNPAYGDSIFNSADDNASGAAGIIALAEAFSQQGARPRRSLIFLVVGGGRQSAELVPVRAGSRYFSLHPPVPTDQIVAALELDMIGRNWPEWIAVLGKKLSDLGVTIDRIAAAHPELHMMPLEDRWLGWRNRSLRVNFIASDSYNFAKQGIPVLRFWDMGHLDYGQATDDVVVIDADKASRVARLVFYVAYEIGDANARPRWDPALHRAIVVKDSLFGLPLQP